MLQKIDQERLEAVLQIIEESNIRFPVAEIVKRTGVDKGMVSAYLNGKKPISDNFYSSFMEKFAPKPDLEREKILKKRIDDLELDVKLLKHTVVSLQQVISEPAKNSLPSEKTLKSIRPK